ncbi:DUF3307 domain-containing protein [Cereibacter changlensis]|uniref:DUF3307 domain-containing protein n=1 Tax=Cereibacter changlensis TaxID=402884 RepID=A0A4U0Z541_9RHOB|nr:DUF3307 domain-containing protein [Cereibacter changlensis]TKA96623.1 DUF3307 domain-containing protein [Cereibacter changlensis]
MSEILAALLLAHAVADFVLQPDWMVRRKREPWVLLAHAAVVLALSQLAVGHAASPWVLGLAGLHLAIDAVKTHLARPGLAAFLADQAAHLAVILGVALLAPDLWETGLWAALPERFAALPQYMLLAAGLILATRAGGVAVGLLMRAQAAEDPPARGLPKGGTTIGYLERGLIFILILSGQPEATGFLIAAKSILRFGAVSEDRAASEYVIIGTLASFGWAIATALAVQHLATGLPPLEIPRPTP